MDSQLNNECRGCRKGLELRRSQWRKGGGGAETGDRVNRTSISQRAPCSIRVIRGGGGHRESIAVDLRDRSFFRHCCLPGVVSGLIQAEDSRSWIESRAGENDEGHLVTTASCPSRAVEDRVRGELTWNKHRGRYRHQRLQFEPVAYSHPRVTCALEPSCQAGQAVHTPCEPINSAKLSTILMGKLS